MADMKNFHSVSRENVTFCKFDNEDISFYRIILEYIRGYIK